MRSTKRNLAQFEVVNGAQKKATVKLNPRIDLQGMAEETSLMNSNTQLLAEP